MWNASSSIVNTGPIKVLIVKLCHCNVLFSGSACSQSAIEVKKIYMSKPGEECLEVFTFSRR